MINPQKAVQWYRNTYGDNTLSDYDIYKNGIILYDIYYNGLLSSNICNYNYAFTYLSKI